MKNIEIFDYNNNGIGVGKNNDKIVFVPNTVVGDIVDCDLVKRQKNYDIAQVNEFVSKSEYRIKSKCEHSNECGGCNYMDLLEKKEHDIKENYVNMFIRRKFNEETQQSIEIFQDMDYYFYNYRNKVVFHTEVINGKIVFGYFKKSSRDIVKINSCEVIKNDMYTTAKKLVSCINEYADVKQLNLIKHIVVRQSTKTNQILLGVVISKKDKSTIDMLKNSLNSLQIYSLATTVININAKDNIILGKDNIVVSGSGFIQDSINGVDYQIALTSFFQINVEQTEKLYNLIGDMLKDVGVNTVVDGYAGVGTIALSLSSMFDTVIAVEVIESAYNDALENIKNNKVNNVQMLFGKFEQHIEEIALQNEKFALVLDPPRRGCDKDVINTILQNDIPYIVYVSCDLKGFVKDMQGLKEAYQIEKIVSINMFPRTKDTESIFLLKKL